MSSMVVSVAPRSTAASVQSLLHAFSESKDAFSLAKRASMASTLLPRSPGLFAVALDVLASAYQLYILESEQVCIWRS